MRSDALLISTLCFAAFSSACESLGDCDDPNKGRNPVLVGGQVMYAGQSVIVNTCMSCHSVDSKGEIRQGSPAGLDFDLRPLSSSEQGADGKLVLDQNDLARLRAGQRKVFEERESIWKQIAKDLMPPKGKGEAFRQVDVGKPITGISGGECTLEAESLGSISEGAARDAVRSWLACGAPIVEANAGLLQQNQAGTLGDQFPSCQGTEPVAASFENVFDTAFKSCPTCHTPGGLWAALDLSTPAVAYTGLLGASGDGSANSLTCDSRPFVTPGEPDESYLMAKLQADPDKRCQTGRMPFESGLPADQIELVRRWIEDGAVGPVSSTP